MTSLEFKPYHSLFTLTHYSSADSLAGSLGLRCLWQLLIPESNARFILIITMKPLMIFPTTCWLILYGISC